jgi:uncharacterized protein with PQ loop repeat
MPHKSYRKLKRSDKSKTSPQLERLVLFVAIAEPLMTIPQIIQIYIEHNTGSSIVTWTLYLSASIVWLIYGVKARNTPILTTAILWIIMEVVVVIGIITVR